MSFIKQVKKTINSPRKKAINILLVGQVYLDTILSIDGFPEEDAKIRASDSEFRTGGNSCNTAEVLAQFSNNSLIKVWYMSAVGSKETSSFVIDKLEQKNIDIKPFLYRADATIPTSYIIQNTKNGSRTIISHNDIKDIQYDEFCETFTKLKNDTDNNDAKWWVHFEGRNIDEALRQIDWLDNTAKQENWRPNLMISCELEKPERENIEKLIPRGDVLFFSKLFAQKKGFDDPMLFLDYYRDQIKPKEKKGVLTATIRALLSCTWGSSGGFGLDHSTDNKYHAPALTSKKAVVVDSVGAGDSFNAGMILALSLEIELETCLNFACSLATLKVGQKGYDGLKDQLFSM